MVVRHIQGQIIARVRQRLLNAADDRRKNIVGNIRRHNGDAVAARRASALGADIRAAAASAFNEPLLLEDGKRLPHGLAAVPELLGKRVFRFHAFAGLIFAVFDLLLDGIHQKAIFRSFLFCVCHVIVPFKKDTCLHRFNTTLL